MSPCVTSLFLLVFSALALSVSASGSCYDCNYSPTGKVRVSNGSWVDSANTFEYCSLTNREYTSFVNKWDCASGKCFIRRESNGFVFRGCADSWNLPDHVNTATNCLHQSNSGVGGYHQEDKGALWWFCDGKLCNDIDIDQECGDVGRNQERDYTPLDTGKPADNTHSDYTLYDSYDLFEDGDYYIPPWEQKEDKGPAAEPTVGHIPLYHQSDETVHGQEFVDPTKFLRDFHNRRKSHAIKAHPDTSSDSYYARSTGEKLYRADGTSSSLEPQAEYARSYDTAAQKDTSLAGRGFYGHRPHWWSYFIPIRPWYGALYPPYSSADYSALPETDTSDHEQTHYKSPEEHGHYESYEEPTQIKSFDEPTHVKSYEQPRHYKSYEEPRHYKTYEEPAQYKSYEEPTDSKSYEEPRHSKTYEEPAHYKSYEEPTHYKSYEEPTHYKSYEEPTHYKSYEEPTHSKSYEEPANYKSYGKPTHYKSYEEPTQYKSHEEPRQYKSREEPRQYKSYEEPTQYKSYAEPRQYKSYEEPRQYKSYEEPRQYKSYEEPTQHRSYEPPRQHRSHEEPAHHRAYEEPKQYKSYEEPIDSKSFERPEVTDKSQEPQVPHQKSYKSYEPEPEHYKSYEPEPRQAAQNSKSYQPSQYAPRAFMPFYPMLPQYWYGQQQVERNTYRPPQTTTTATTPTTIAYHEYPTKTHYSKQKRRPQPAPTLKKASLSLPIVRYFSDKTETITPVEPQKSHPDPKSTHDYSPTKSHVYNPKSHDSNQRTSQEYAPAAYDFHPKRLEIPSKTHGYLPGKSHDAPPTISHELPVKSHDFLPAKTYGLFTKTDAVDVGVGRYDAGKNRPHPSGFSLHEKYADNARDARGVATERRYDDTPPGPVSPPVHQTSRYDDTPPAPVSAPVHQSSRYDASNPCNGDCSSNPSGLFRDPLRPDGFIQCGANMLGDNPCTCCQPFYHKCPSGATFDDVTNVCSILVDPKFSSQEFTQVK